MNRTTKILIFFIVVLASLMVSCEVLKVPSGATGPEEIYWNYWNACDQGKTKEAEQMLTEKGKLQSQYYGFGPCSLTHDFIYKMQIISGPQEKMPEFSKAKPEVSIKDDTATLTWMPIDGSITQIIVLKKIDGTWKINEIIMMN